MTITERRALVDSAALIADADAIILALARDRETYRGIAVAALEQLAKSERTVRALRQEIACRTDKWVTHT